MTSYQRHNDAMIPTTSPWETLTRDDTLAGLSEATHLISSLPPGTGSYGSESTFLPKRRTRARMSKLEPPVASFDYNPAAEPRSSSANAHNAEYELDDDEEQAEQPSSHEVSNPNLASPAGSGQNGTSAAWLALNNASRPPQQLSPFFSSEFYLSLSSTTTLRLENQGSVARDHLASERTFLAYIRTSIAIASAGVGKFHSPWGVILIIKISVLVALVQLFTVATAFSSNNVSPYTREIHTFVYSFGAITVLLGLLVLITGNALSLPRHQNLLNTNL